MHENVHGNTTLVVTSQTNSNVLFSRMHIQILYIQATEYSTAISTKVNKLQLHTTWLNLSNTRVSNKNDIIDYALMIAFYASSVTGKMNRHGQRSVRVMVIIPEEAMDERDMRGLSVLIMFHLWIYFYLKLTNDLCIFVYICYISKNI